VNKFNFISFLFFIAVFEFRPIIHNILHPALQMLTPALKAGGTISNHCVLKVQNLYKGSLFETV
jgi:hypothetical protein